MEVVLKPADGTEAPTKNNLPTVQDREVELGGLMGVAESTPEEAAYNIGEAEKLDISPDTYKDLKEELEPKVKAERAPQSVDGRVMEVAAKSREHASVVEQDLPVLNMLPKYARFMVNTLKGTDIGREVSALQYKAATGQKLTADEINQLDNLNDELQSLNSGEEFNYNFWESLPATIVGSGANMIEGLWGNKELIALGAGTGAVGGAVLGAPMGFPGMVVGGKLGALRGAVVGTTTAFFKDTFEQSAGQIYNDMQYLIDESVESELPKAEEDRRAVAIGGGLIVGAVGLIPGGYIASKVPWMKAIATPRSFVKFASTLQGNKWSRLAIDMVKSGLAEGLEEGSQETVKIVTEEMAKTFDGTETSFIEGLTNAGKKYQEYSGRIGESVIAGAAAGAGFYAGARAAGTVIEPALGIKKPAPKAPPKTPPSAPPGQGPTTIGAVKTDITGPVLPTAVKATRAIQLKVALEQASTLMKNTNLKKLLPGEADIMRQKVFDDVGMPDIYVDKEALNKWADSEEKAKKARAILDSSGVAASQINAPIRVEAYKFSQLVDEHPEVSNLAKLAPEYGTAEQYVKKYEEANQQRQAIEESMGTVLPKGTPTEQRIQDEDIFGEIAFLEQETHTEKMGEVLPKEEILKVNKAQALARVEVADAINADNDKQMNKVLDLAVEFQTLLEREYEADKLRDNKKIKLVENYLANKGVVGRPPKDIADRMKAGGRAFAIDPNSLSKKLRDKYIDDEVLKKRKVFDKKGRDVNEVITVYGVSSPAEFLKIMSETPDREQAITNAIAQREEQIKAGTRKHIDFDESKLAKAYNNMANNHLKGLKIILDKHYGAFKSSVMRMALDIPALRSKLQSRAKETVGNTRVKSLNANQWKVGERRSTRKSVKAVLENRFEEAAREKENAAYNTVLAKETHIAIGKVNNAMKWVANLSSKDMQNMLKDAGSLYVDAVNAILDVYNFDPSKKGQANVDGYIKFAKQKLKEGQGDYRVPDEVLEWLTVQKSANELTVDQFLFLTDKMREVVQQARLKNKLLSAYLKNQENHSTEIIAETAKELAEQHPDYDANKVGDSQGIVSIADKIGNWLSLASSQLTNIQFIAQHLDKGVIGEFWAKMIYQPLDGTGVHEGPYGMRAKGVLQAALKKRWLNAVKIYGESEFSKLGVTKVRVKEFKGIKSLSHGKLTKLDLLTMAMHIGNEENLSRLENFGVSSDTILKVIETHLTQKDLDFIQSAVWGTFATLKPRIAEVEMATRGVDIDFTVPRRFTMFGKVYEGGHMRLSYKKDTSILEMIKKNKSLSDAADPEKKADFTPDYVLEGIVRSPHTKVRTGSDWQVDLGFETIDAAFEDVLHDVTMRIPVRDVTKFITDPTVAHSIAGVVGDEDYNTLVHLVAAQTKSIAAEGLLFGHHQKLLYKTIAQVESAAAVNYIAFNPSSMLVSLKSLTQVLDKMGMVSGSKHLSRTAMKVLNPLNLQNFGQYVKFAEELDPNIGNYRQGIDEFSGTALSNVLPKERLFVNKPYNLIKSFQERQIRRAFEGILGGIDVAIKTVTALSSYNQFMAGEAPGWSYDKIMSMSKEDRYKAAKGYVAQLSASTLMAPRLLDKAPVQQLKVTRMLAKYWNESRNALNNVFQDKRNIKYSVDAMVKHAKNGDFAEANAAFYDAGDQATRMLMLSMLGLVIVGVARGKNPFAKDETEEKKDTDIADAPEWMLSRLTTVGGLMSLGHETLTSNIPVVRDVIFTMTSDRPYSIPVTSMLTDIAMTGGAAYDVFIGASDEIGWIDAAQQLDDKQIRSVMNTSGLLVGGLPVSAYFKYNDMLGKASEGPISTEANGMSVLDLFLGGLAYFIEKYKGKKEEDMTADEWLKQDIKEESGEKSLLESAVEQAEEIYDALTDEEIERLSPHAYEVIAFAESKGKWNAQPIDKVTKKLLSNAFGLYQFLPGTWKDIVESPEGQAAGLTITGRLKSTTTQQQIAMEIFTNKNIAKMREDKVPINLISVYFAHHFGPSHAKKVFLSKDDTKIPEIFTKKNIKANKWMQGKSTAKDIKDFLREHLKRAEAGLNRKKETGEKIDIDTDDMIIMEPLD